MILASWFDGTPASEKANEISKAYDATIPDPVSQAKYTITQINIGHTTNSFSRGSSHITMTRRPNSRFLRSTRPRRGRRASHWSMSIRFLTVTSDSGLLQHHLTVLRTPGLYDLAAEYFDDQTMDIGEGDKPSDPANEASPSGSSDTPGASSASTAKPSLSAALSHFSLLLHVLLGGCVYLELL